MRGRVLRAAGLAAALVLLTTGAALAAPGGRGTETSTQQFRDFPLFNQAITNPCTGEPGMLDAIAKTGVFHTTSFAVGTGFWLTTTAQGTVTFTPADPNGVSASGHFAEWHGVSINNRNEVVTDTSTFQLWGTDGSHIAVHEVVHLGANANGLVTVTFDNVDVRCG
jgi:hypothetical protein